MDNSLIAGMPEVIAYIKKIEEENKKLARMVADQTLKVCNLQVELEGKDAFWNDWLNEEFGDELYPLDPPEPDEFVEKVKKLQQAEQEVERLQKYAEIMGDIDGDQLTDLLKDCGWEYNDDLELVKVTD